jgi:hypothetical protein
MPELAAIMITPHAYERSPHSGAGNCVCGVPERHRRHPHEFMRALIAEPKGSQTLCTCALPLVHPIHRQEGRS